MRKYFFLSWIYCQSISLEDSQVWILWNWRKYSLNSPFPRHAYFYKSLAASLHSYFFKKKCKNLQNTFSFPHAEGRWVFHPLSFWLPFSLSFAQQCSHLSITCPYCYLSLYNHYIFHSLAHYGLTFAKHFQVLWILQSWKQNKYRQ